MITLKTIHQSSAQAVFEQGARHLLTQGKAAVEKGRCLYRTADSLSCVGGCFIADDEYRPHVEGLSWAQLNEKQYVPDEHSELIRQLQVVHDGVRSYPDWVAGLKHVANRNCLDHSFIDAEFPNWQMLPLDDLVKNA